MKRVGWLVIFILIFAVGATGLYNKISEYRKGEEEYEELEQYFVSNNETVLEENTKDNQNVEISPNVNFEELLKINGDIVAWVYIPGTGISYPVVQGEDNSYYVSHTVKGSKNKAGAIFLDYSNSYDFSDTNSILYGHNLQNGKMFSGLRNFLNVSYLKEHDEVIIYTENEEKHYNIVSAFKARIDSDIYKKKNIENEDDKEAFFRNICKLKEVDGVTNIITLSTCTNVDKDERIVVVACN